MKFVQGLHRDNHPADQPEGTYRDAKNLVFNEQRGALANEPGHISTSLISESYHPIGSTILPDGRIIVFSADGAGGSEIGIIQKTGVYEILVNDPRLNFSLDHPIQATSRVALRRSISQQFSEPVETQITEDPIVVQEDVIFEINPTSPSP